MEMEQQYGITDLTHYMNRRPDFNSVVQPPPHYDMVAGAGGGDCGGADGGGNGRWPRQETLSLLEVRSRLDSKFKEANQKGPLWDEVSRIMSEEHGYQRNGKKCREKFENLYKYYKKTKEGKAGRQDGKHYRFFRQLEALYGETSLGTNPNPSPASFSDVHNLNVNGGSTSSFQAHQNPNNGGKYQEAYQHAPSRPYDSLSLSNNSSAFDASSSDYSNLNAGLPSFMENSDCVERTIGRKMSWKTKIKNFIDTQMTKIMEKQELWMEKMMKTIEQKEHERVIREEQWRNEEAERFEREHKFWANERASMESRDSALMEALHKLTGKDSIFKSLSPEYCNDQSQNDQSIHGKIENDNYNVNDLTGWGENEISRLIQIRTSMETRFEQNGYMEEVLWDEIASKMAYSGYHRNGVVCKAKWDNINEFLTRTKKRKENTRSSNSYSQHNYESFSQNFHHQGVDGYHQGDERSIGLNDHHQNDGCNRFLMGDQENIWEGYVMKLTKEGNH